MVVSSPAACGPQIDESHWGSIASPAPPTPASSPGQCRMSRDPLRSVARRVRCPGTTAPPSEMLTPTDGLLRSATSTGRPTQLLRGDRRVLSEKKPKSSRLRARTKKPTAHKGVRYRQPCCRGRSARAAGTRTHPADATRWFETPPRKTRVHPVKLQAAPLLRPSTLRDSRLSQACGRQVIKLTTGSEACGCEASLRAAKTRAVH